jgi:uncharacterized protein (DUF1684 family)
MRQRLLALTLLISTVAASAAAVFVGPEAHLREVGKGRAERLERLTAPDGWLALVGLHFLKVGDNRVGHAPANDVVLAGAPAEVGTVTVGGDGRVTLRPLPGRDVRVDGQEVKGSVVLREEVGTTKPSLVTTGTLTFFVIERGGKKALRVRDTEAPTRKHFRGLDYFPIDSQWRIEARWQPFERARLQPLTNILGQPEMTIFPGRAVFEYEGKTYELLAIDEGEPDTLFFVISDATSGRETYGAARFLYAPRPKGDTILLDFNLLYNPPCAFTAFATCPLPPKENRLPFAIRAGEKNYRGAQH